MSAVIWVHMDALSRYHPVFNAAPEGVRAFYIWDAEDIKRRGWSLKRCVFVLECLEDMGVEIVEGRYVEVLKALNAEAIYTAKTPDPSLRSVIKSVGAKMIKAPSFASVPSNADMGRFFRYWNKAKRTAMAPTGHGNEL